MRDICEDEREDARMQEKELRMGERPLWDEADASADQDEEADDITDLTHPTGRAFHNLNNGLQILVGYDLLDAEAQAAARESLRERIEAVLPDLTALQQYIDRQEENLRTMAEESNETHRLLTAEREKTAGALAALRETNDRVAAVQHDLEHLYTGATMDLERHTTRFNAIARMRQKLDPTLAQPIGIIRNDTPRLAVAGGT